jgi:superfamily I DNA/RNA helicase
MVERSPYHWTLKMVDLDSLNPEQRLGVTHFEGPTMILAGAGTGKTRVITCRIAYMLDAGVAPDSIAAMTFTNKAAREMKERIRPMVGSTRAKKLSISTFHSFCLNIMRTWPQKVVLDKGFTLVGT